MLEIIVVENNPHHIARARIELGDYPLTIASSYSDGLKELLSRQNTPRDPITGNGVFFLTSLMMDYHGSRGLLPYGRKYHDEKLPYGLMLGLLAPTLGVRSIAIVADPKEAAGHVNWLESIPSSILKSLDRTYVKEIFPEDASCLLVTKPPVNRDGSKSWKKILNAMHGYDRLQGTRNSL